MRAKNGLRATKISWEKARRDYISDPTMSYRKIGLKYGVAEKSVEGHAEREGWIQTRDKLAAKANVKAEEKIVDELAEINLRHSQSYLTAQALALESANVLVDDIRYKKKLAQTTGGRLTSRDIYSPQMLKFLTDALDTAIRGERVTRNMPTQSIVQLEHKGAIANIQITSDQWEKMRIAATTDIPERVPADDQRSEDQE